MTSGDTSKVQRLSRPVGATSHGDRLGALDALEELTGGVAGLAEYRLLDLGKRHRKGEFVVRCSGDDDSTALAVPAGDVEAFVAGFEMAMRAAAIIGDPDRLQAIADATSVYSLTYTDGYSAEQRKAISETLRAAAKHVKDTGRTDVSAAIAAVSENRVQQHAVERAFNRWRADLDGADPDADMGKAERVTVMLKRAATSIKKASPK